MKLRRGKAKTILESAIDSALLAVEVYNKPRTTLRSEAYIALMNIILSLKKSWSVSPLPPRLKVTSHNSDKLSMNKKRFMVYSGKIRR